MDKKYIAFDGEVMLLGWKETHNGGAQVVLQLADADQLDAFKTMTIRKGKIAGQRLACVMVEIDEEERPVDQTTRRVGGAIAILCARWCSLPEFQAFLVNRFPHTNANAIKSLGFDGIKIDPEEVAAETVRLHCGVPSRAELDHDDRAARIFHEEIRIPFAAILEHQR